MTSERIAIVQILQIAISAVTLVAFIVSVIVDEPRLMFEDAKFMLVSCAAFTNYLTAKAARPLERG